MGSRPLALLSTLSAALVAGGCELVLPIDQFPRPEPDAAVADAGTPDVGAPDTGAPCVPTSCAGKPCGTSDDGCGHSCEPGSGCVPATHHLHGLTLTPLAGAAAPQSGGTAGARAVRATSASGEVSNGNKVIHRLTVSP